jgi:hypothetical protein
VNLVLQHLHVEEGVTMPNGRSGGFLISRADLEQLLRDVPSDAEIGKTLSSRVTTAEFIRMLRKQRKNEIVIEEQDNAWYIVHLGVHLSAWITVDESSLVHSSFRKCHAQWVRARPG